MLLIPSIPHIYNVFAESPIFGPSVNIDNDYESNVDTDKYENNNTASFDDLPIDILSTTYFSDGRTLNGTIWLSDPIYDERHDDYVRSNLTYSMEIFGDDMDGNPETYYNIIIYPEPDGTWTKEVQEYEPYLGVMMPEQTYRILESIPNQSGFYEDGHRYIDLSVDLDTIGLSSEYWVDFFVNATNKIGTDLSDYVLLEHAPQRKQIILYDWPDLIKVRAGAEEITTIVPINTTDLNAKEKDKLTDANKDDGIILNFEPQTVDLPLSGITYTKMTIKADKDTYEGNTTLTNQTVTVNAITEDGVLANWNETFALEILPPLSAVENIGNVLRNNNLSYVIPLGITSAFAVWLSKRLPKVSYDPERIRVKDILTVDASVIAGVLIFLTVGASEVFSGKAIQQVGILTASIVFPFAIAAIWTLIKGTVEGYGIKFMVSGFIYLMTSVILIAFIQK